MRKKIERKKRKCFILISIFCKKRVLVSSKKEFNFRMKREICVHVSDAERNTYVTSTLILKQAHANELVCADACKFFLRVLNQ